MMTATSGSVVVGASTVSRIPLSTAVGRTLPEPVPRGNDTIVLVPPRAARDAWGSIPAMPSPRMTRIVRALGIGIGVISVIALAYGIAFWHAGHAFPGDTLTYYLAGTRLNEGHHLYDLAADDVWLYAHPEFPLFGPPLIAVVWRPLAAIPNGWGMILWLVAMNYCALTAVFWTLLGTRGWAGVLVLVLVPSLTLLMGVGNVDAAILLGVIVVWTLVAAERPKAAGILVGVLASLKLTPAIFLDLVHRAAPVDGRRLDGRHRARPGGRRGHRHGARDLGPLRAGHRGGIGGGAARRPDHPRGGDRRAVRGPLAAHLVRAGDRPHAARLAGRGRPLVVARARGDRPVPPAAQAASGTGGWLAAATADDATPRG